MLFGKCYQRSAFHVEHLRHPHIVGHALAPYVHDGTVSSLRRFKEDAREVAAGYECGVGVQGFGDFKEGDLLEFYREEEAG